MRIKQGDAYDIEITLTDDDGTAITPEMVDAVEVSLGQLNKKHPGEVYYDDVWVFPLAQQDTFKLSGALPLDIRVKFADESVAGASLGVVAVSPSGSKEVI